MTKYKILWADDEIDLLKPHILFLEQKGYDITAVNSGVDALEKVKESTFDIIFLDENMPGMSGLDVLQQVKLLSPITPVVMITKSEEEHIMEEAIGSKISDYLIKPLNPNQILLSTKKILENKRLVAEKTTAGYQQEFRQIAMTYSDNRTYTDWVETYMKLIFWEIEIDRSGSKEMREIIDMQKTEANRLFCDFVAREYEKWLTVPNYERPILSHQIIKKKVFPLLGAEPVFFILIDNLRYDQWKTLEPYIAELYTKTEEQAYFSILPSTTEYARNAIFSGMTPLEIQRLFPNLWEDSDEDSKNHHEETLLAKLVQKQKPEWKTSYHKIIHSSQGKQLNDRLHNLMHNQLNAVVYNFVDMLSHSRTDMTVIKELAPDEAAYRSITTSWFQHSTLLELLQMLATLNVKVVITTDHGTVKVRKPLKILADKETNTNLRYKMGRNLNFDEKLVYFTRKPENLFLPKRNMTTSFAFAREDQFFVYPTNQNQYVNMYKETFQHGGISMEELIIPFVVLEPKK